MHLGVVAQRLVVPDALYRRGDGLPVQDTPLRKTDLQSAALLCHALQDLLLDLAHQPHADLAAALIPQQMQLGVLLLQRPQPGQGGMGIAPLRQRDAVAHHRLQQGRGRVGSGAQTLSGVAAAQARHGGHGTGGDLLRRLIFRAGIQPDLINLFPAAVGAAFAGQRRAHPQAAAGHLQVGQAVALFIGGDLIHLRRKFVGIRWRYGQGIQPRQQGVYALQTQRRTKVAGEQLPSGNRLGHGPVGKRPPRQIVGHQPLAAQRQRLRVGVGGHTARMQFFLQFVQQRGAVGARLVHLVDEQKGRDPVPLQQPPQRFGVALHACRAADDQHGVIQHRQRPLHFGGKIRVARGIQQRQGGVRQRQPRLLGKDGDPPAALQRVVVQKGVPVVHPPGPPQRPGAVQHRFGQGGFAAVHVRQQACAEILLHAAFHAGGSSLRFF